MEDSRDVFRPVRFFLPMVGTTLSPNTEIYGGKGLERLYYIFSNRFLFRQFLDNFAKMARTRSCSISAIAFWEMAPAARGSQIPLYVPMRLRGLNCGVRITRIDRLARRKISRNQLVCGVMDIFCIFCVFSEAREGALQVNRPVAQGHEANFPGSRLKPLAIADYLLYIVQ